MGRSIYIGAYTKPHRGKNLFEISKLEAQLTPFGMGIWRIQLMHKNVWGERGDIKTSKRVQLEASFKCKVCYGAGGKRSRTGWKRGRRRGGEGGRGGHRELEIIASIDEVTLGGFQHDWESEWATGSWRRAKRSLLCQQPPHSNQPRIFILRA